MTPILESALKARGFGVSVVSTRGDKTPAIPTWAARQSTPPSAAAIRRDFENPEAAGFATIGGAVSGGLEILDFDLGGEFLPAFEVAVNAEAPGLLARLAMQRTMSGGRHIRCRCPETKIPGNQKLAHKKIEVPGPGLHTFGGKEYQAQPRGMKYFIFPVAIETRGEGGYAVCAPSPGYEVMQVGENGDHLNPPSITSKEREVLLRCARALDEKPPEQIKNGPRLSPANIGGKRPGDDYNERPEAFQQVLDLQLKRGWTIHSEREALVQLRRPGGKAKISATLYKDSGVLHNWSGNAAPFEEDASYSPFSVFALLEHGGDFSTAARELGRQGYGAQADYREPPRRPLTEEEEERLAIQNEPPAGACEEKEENPWAKAVISFEQLRNTPLPERAPLLYPWLTEKSISLLYSWRGTGKSFFILGIIRALTSGEPFGPWECKEPVPCLYLDGEMPARMLQERAEEMNVGGPGTKAPARLISRDYALELGLPAKTLMDPEWREQLSEILISGGYKAFFLDNLSSLTPGLDENPKEKFDPINQWLLGLRFKGVSTVPAHHAGKAGTQRGSSGREDNIDNSILLKRPRDYEITDGCRFVCTFEKDRCREGRHLLTDHEFSYQGGAWIFSNSKTKTLDQVLRLLDKGRSQKDIAGELGLSAGRVSQICRDARQKGLVTNDNRLTQTGFFELLGAQPI